MGPRAQFVRPARLLPSPWMYRVLLFARPIHAVLASLLEIELLGGDLFSVLLASPPFPSQLASHPKTASLSFPLPFSNLVFFLFLGSFLSPSLSFSLFLFDICFLDFIFLCLNYPRQRFSTCSSCPEPPSNSEVQAYFDSVVLLLRASPCIVSLFPSFIDDSLGSRFAAIGQL